MPWVDKNKCNGCGLCVANCPVNAILIKNGKAEINMNKCIRCGNCHNICPKQAVRHDSEKNPVIIEKNINEINKLIKSFKTKKEKNDFLKRMIKHYNNEKKISEETIKKIEEIIE